MDIDRELVFQKCKYILADVQRLRDMLQQLTHEEIVTNEMNMSLAERRLERIVNRAVDVNFHLVRAAGAPPPDDYTKSFLALGEHHIVDSLLAINIAPAAGARNILVHDYEDLDPEKFYSSLQDTVKYFPQYVIAVTDYINTRLNLIP